MLGGIGMAEDLKDKKALIIGVEGFVGSYLVDCLHDEFNMEIYATKLRGKKYENSKANIYDLDIMEKQEIVNLLYAIRHRRQHTDSHRIQPQLYPQREQSAQFKRAFA